MLENNYDILHDAKGNRVLQDDYELIVIRKVDGNQGVLSRKIVFSRTDLQPNRQYIYKRSRQTGDGRPLRRLQRIRQREFSFAH